MWEDERSRLAQSSSSELEASMDDVESGMRGHAEVSALRVSGFKLGWATMSMCA